MWRMAVIVALFGACGSDGKSEGAEVDALRERVAELEQAASTTTEGTTTTAPPVSAVPMATAPPPTVVVTTTTTAASPRGSLRTLGPPTYGQGFPSGQCARWRLKFVNNSSAEIVQIVFDPKSADYSNFSEFNQETQQHAPDVPAEKPLPTKLNVSLPPGAEQILDFQSCTRTPQPSNRNYEFGTTPPDTFPFTWVTGHRGIGPAIATCQSANCK